MAWIESHQERSNKNNTLKYKFVSEITLKFKGICQHCGKKGKIKLVMGCYYRAYKNGIAFEVHHQKPLSKGGNHNEENLILLCRKCHKSIYHSKKGYKNA